MDNKQINHKMSGGVSAMDKTKVCKGNGRIGLGRELRFEIGWCAKAPLPEEIFERVKNL